MRDRPLTIIQINTSDIGGGAEKVAYKLHETYRAIGHRSILAVGYKKSTDPDVISIPLRTRKGRTLRGWFKVVLEHSIGAQYLEHPASHRIAELVNEPIDIFHFHNLHGGYFDLAAVPRMSNFTPTVLTLHDCWPFTGHCSHPLGCERWQTGCGQCPDITIYPPLSRDGTRFNWARKRRLYGSSRLWITAPSQWLLNKIERSSLSTFPRRLVYNGVDLKVFMPGSMRQARLNLGLPLNRKIILFSAKRGEKNPWKDFTTLNKAFDMLTERMSQTDRPLLLVVGADRKDLKWNTPDNYIEWREFVNDEETMAQFYRCADVLACTSKADNCPLTILEAMSCGLPVVASCVGGIPGIVEHGKTGLLVESGDSLALADALENVLVNSALAKRLGRMGRIAAEAKFDIHSQAKMYLQLYEEIRENFKHNKNK